MDVYMNGWPAVCSGEMRGRVGAPVWSVARVSSCRDLAWKLLANQIISRASFNRRENTKH